MLTWKFADLDARIEQTAQTTIAGIFADQGEEAFRAMEGSCLSELLDQDRMVLATGGGAVLAESSRRLLIDDERLCCVYLAARASTLIERLGGEGRAKRPLLGDGDWQGRIKTIVDERRNLWSQCADHRLDTDGKDIGAIGAELLSALLPATIATGAL